MGLTRRCEWESRTSATSALREKQERDHGQQTLATDEIRESRIS
jgi:hypothetical protein